MWSSRTLLSGAPLARAVAKYLKVLRHLCRFAVSRKLLATDPTAGFPLPVERNPRRPVADRSRFEQVMETAPEVTMYGPKRTKVPTALPLLLRLAHDTGRRVGAILSLRWSDWLSSQAPHGSLRWRSEHDKVGREWIIPVTAAVRDALTIHQLTTGGADEAPLFPRPGHPSEPWGKDGVSAVSRWLREAEKRAGLAHLPGGGFHAYRRGWATARKGLSLKDVMEAGGWTDSAALLKCYQHADAESILAVVTHDA